MSMLVSSPRPASLGRRGLLACAAAAAATVGLFTTSTDADVAEQIPADALFAIKINGAQAVADDFAALAKEWGLDQMEPGFGDPIQSLKDEADGKLEGIDFDGEVAIYAPANADFEGTDPPFVFLVPVSDVEAFTDNFENVREEDGVMVGESEGDDVFMKPMGDYMAMTPYGELLTIEGELGLALGGPTGSALADEDVTLYANFPALAPLLAAAVEEAGGKEMLLEELENGFENGDVPEGLLKYKPVARAAVNQAFTVLESFLRDAEAATVSVDFNPDAGIVTNVVAQFKEDSYLGETFGDMEATDGSLLTGLPASTYLLFGGSTADPEQGIKLFEDVVGPILAELEEVGGVDGIGAYVDEIRTFIKAQTGSKFGLMAPDTAAIGRAPLIQQVTIQAGDAEKLMGATRNMAAMGPELMKAFAAEAGEAGEMPAMDVTFEEDAKTVDGVTFAKASTQMPSNDPMAAMFMQQIFGPEGQTSYMGVVDDETFLSYGGLSDEMVASVISTVREGASPLDADVDGLLAELPGDRSAVAFIQVAEIARTGLGAAQMFGMAPPVQIPQNLPPIGIAVGPDDESLRIGVIVPKDLVSAMIVTTLQVQQGMGGGPNQGL